MRLPVLIKPFVQPGQETGPPAYVCPVLIPQQAIKRVLKVILYHRAVIGLFQLVPHHGKMSVLPFQHSLHFLPVLPRLGIFCNIPVAGMNVYHIRPECIQLGIPKHSILKILPILRLIELRLNPLGEQKQLQYTHNIMGSAPSQDGHLLFYPGIVLFQKRTLYFFRILQYIFIIKRVFQFSQCFSP